MTYIKENLGSSCWINLDGVTWSWVVDLWLALSHSFGEHFLKKIEKSLVFNHDFMMLKWRELNIISRPQEESKNLTKKPKKVNTLTRKSKLEVNSEVDTKSQDGDSF